ncbi:MAG: prepilin peptidase [Patescibacteria group bacterium]|jgi:prepilin signal peptidase PulO-like enzyme (type II secretory pathway)|nr:prepilin peptidase [Candidatus Magasanikbacteria bacterium]HQL52405.1 prepilin peptidase [Candidatus Magasanikbacteria bacterium]
MLNIIQYILVFILGLAIGSFLNVCVWRKRKNISVIQGRSMCPNCQVFISWFDNIPLLSFILLRGKCRKCFKKISWQYPIIELITGLLFLFIAWWHQQQNIFLNLEMIRDWLIVSFLIFIFVYDLKYKEILTLPVWFLSALLFIFSLFTGWNIWYKMLIGALVGSGFFFFQYIISKGKWIGGGDVRLGFLLGIILGWPNILLALFVSYILGALSGLYLIIKNKKNMKSEVPLGVYLTIGTFVTMFWGEKIIKWYISFLK